MYKKILGLREYGASAMAQRVRNPPANAGNTGDAGLISELGRSPRGKAWQPTPVFLPGKPPWKEEPGRL